MQETVSGKIPQGRWAVRIIWVGINAKDLFLKCKSQKKRKEINLLLESSFIEPLLCAEKFISVISKLPNKPVMTAWFLLI